MDLRAHRGRRLARVDVRPLPDGAALAAVARRGGGAVVTDAQPPAVERIAIVCDGERWHVRRIALVENDWQRGHKVYRCDMPISSDHRTLAEVPQVAALLAARGQAKPDAVEGSDTVPEIEVLIFNAVREMEESIQGTLTGIEWRRRMETRARVLVRDVSALVRIAALVEGEAIARDVGVSYGPWHIAAEAAAHEIARKLRTLASAPAEAEPT